VRKPNLNTAQPYAKAECFFWYRPTWVFPEQRPLNGFVVVVVVVVIFDLYSCNYTEFLHSLSNSLLANVQCILSCAPNISFDRLNEYITVPCSSQTSQLTWDVSK